MKRYINVKPAWRARDTARFRTRYPLIAISDSLHERLHARAAVDGCSGRFLADVFINRALDEAGAP